MRSRARARQAIFVLLTVLCFAVPGSAWSAPDGARDVLWQAVSNCLDPTAFEYCRSCSMPRADRQCPNVGDCAQTLELWTESANYVSLRDAKMCGCAAGFVHGLAVPRAPVTGVEDPRRPSGIWGFAWAAARTRIPEEKEVALYVNPPHTRSQDQLHIHLVRLRADARQRFAGLTVSRILSLDDVWSAARLRAASQGLAEYGVLVSSHPDGGYLVLVTPGSPKEYTQSTCR